MVAAVMLLMMMMLMMLMMMLMKLMLLMLRKADTFGGPVIKFCRWVGEKFEKGTKEGTWRTISKFAFSSEGLDNCILLR